VGETPRVADSSARRAHAAFFITAYRALIPSYGLVLRLRLRLVTSQLKTSVSIDASSVN
jgi:hypothetical protein